jgi:hypothetical protein
MVRWSLKRAGFRMNRDNLLDPLTVDASPALELLDIPELPFDNTFVHPE